MRKTTVSLDESVHTAVRVYCAMRDCQINELFQEAVAEKMDREPLD